MTGGMSILYNTTDLIDITSLIIFYKTRLGAAMKYRIDRSSQESAYLQLYRQLRQDIAEGAYPPGSKLPSKRQLADELGLSLITVEHALALLADEGYAVPKQRSGFYAGCGSSAVSSSVRATVPQMSLSDMPEDFPFSVLARVMRRVLSDYGERILMRSPGNGCEELRTELAEYLLRSRGLHVAPEQIIVGSGAEYLYGLVVQLLGRDRIYAREQPCYEKIRRVYEANGAECEGLAMAGDGISSEALAGSSAGVLHVTPYRSYPSGVTATAAKRREYAAWAREKGAYIVEDDYDSELSVSLPQIETIASLAPERVIYLNTFSKTLAPSMRTGYMVLPAELLPAWRERLGFYSCTVPVFDQLVLAEFIRCGELERRIGRLRRKRRAEEAKQE